MRPATIFWGTGECGGGDGYSGVWAVASFALLGSSARVFVCSVQVIPLWLAARFAILPWALWCYGIVLFASCSTGVLLRAWRHSSAHLGRPSSSTTSCSLWPAFGICPMALGLSFDAVLFKLSHMRPATIFWGTSECGDGDGYSGVWAVASRVLLWWLARSRLGGSTFGLRSPLRRLTVS